MKYFGIKTPAREHQSSYIWWIANTVHDSWSAFFTYPNNVREMNACRPPIADAIRAYQAIGYRSVELSVTVAGESGIEETAPGAVAAAVAAEREACAKVCDDLASMIPGTKTSNTLEFAAKQIRERGYSQ